MIVGGVGVGLVNPPLASTAVGVVPPQQAGMASGINSTFRQVGIATGIALLGTLFSSKVRTTCCPGGRRARPVPTGPKIAAAVQSGGVRRAHRQSARPSGRAGRGEITRAAFTAGLNRILLVAAIIALVSGWWPCCRSAARTSRATEASTVEG